MSTTPLVPLLVVDPTFTAPQSTPPPAYNSYITLADAQAYWHTDPRDGVTELLALDDDAISRYLIQAFRRLERLYYQGRATLPTWQQTRWPRYSVVNLQGWVYDAHSLPVPLLWAQAEEALWIFLHDTTITQRLVDQQTGVILTRIGEAEQRYAAQSDTTTATHVLWSPDAYRLISHTLLTGVQNQSVGNWAFPSRLF